MKSPIWMSCISGLMVLAGCSQSQPVAAAEQVVEPAIAPVLAQAPRTFGGCIADLKQQATDSGIGAETIGRGFMGVRRLDEVIRLDRAQPEFTAGFADYYTRRVSADRIQRGQQLLQRHADLFARIEAEYGVPAHYLLAFWGLETNFGGYFGNTPILSALTTLACDGRRSDFFAGEMINALKLIQAGDLQPEQMRGSWAGAMGHVQFMPTTFLQYAVDGDADGRRDLWGSVPDAMSSAANFLRGLGWQRGVRWGREVTLPDGFDYRQSGLQTRLSLQDWAALGVQTVDGSPIAGADLQAALLVPTGSQGPA
ncbi:MAG: lytic murein transglycosylase, partial [Pseudomonadota bacterium]|nr:lytic murein transglycosylase [Pseudomonadota bacterium]